MDIDMVEVWMPTEFDGYEVSSLGRVRSVDRFIDIKCPHDGQKCRCNKRRFLRGKILKQGLCGGNDPKGEYPFVSIGPVGKSKPKYVHILVAKAFVPNPNSLPEVNHKDGVKAHCWAENLEWTTHIKNEEHAFQIGLKSRDFSNGRFGGPVFT